MHAKIEKNKNETATTTDFDAVVVGAGFAGMYMLHRLRELGLRARVLEAGDGVGGTWYWNRYPGARCDVESMEYSYQFSEELQQDWEWSQRYSPQPEILAYANHVADRFDLRDDIQFNTRVESAHYDESNRSWTVKTLSGESLTSRFCIMATGCLSSANTPDWTISKGSTTIPAIGLTRASILPGYALALLAQAHRPFKVFRLLPVRLVR